MIWNAACLITWISTQTVFALSSGEAEYYAALRGPVKGCFQVIVHTDASACKGVSSKANASES